ncbi:MAG: four helix bundle protein [Pyrinomonadaceae bacterium]
MPTIARFEDIEAWKLARTACNRIYDVSSDGEFSKDFALVNQIRRASVSILSNIAEGFERDGNREFIQFLSVAKGSCGEVRSQLYIAFDRGYVDQPAFDEIFRLLMETSRTLSGFIKYLRQSDEKGRKFR